MTESLRTKTDRWYFNFFPAYRRTGARIIYIRHDYKLIKIKLPLNRATKNYVGTIFGGSMFSATDPIYMVMLMKVLGGNYMVWDKSAEVKFVRPGVETLYATFELTDDQLEKIKHKVSELNESIFDFFVDLKDGNNKIVSRVTKKIYIANKDFYDTKKSRKK